MSFCELEERWAVCSDRNKDRALAGPAAWRLRNKVLGSERRSKIKFTLDGRQVTTAAGTLVIEAAKTQGIEVPSFCYYPGLSLQAACRMCLVEVEKMPKLQTACTLVATDGMVVKTDTQQVHNARKNMLEFLLSNHPLDCPVCDKGGECELQDMTFRYGLDKTRFIEEKLHYSRREMVAAGLLRRAALHPLLPLRARVRRRHGRESAGRRRTRSAIGHSAQQVRRTRLRRMRHVH